MSPPIAFFSKDWRHEAGPRRARGRGGLMLFGQLNIDIFTLFSGSNRHLYEVVLVRIYQDFFRSDLRFPSQAEIDVCGQFDRTTAFGTATSAEE